MGFNCADFNSLQVHLPIFIMKPLVRDIFIFFCAHQPIARQPAPVFQFRSVTSEFETGRGKKKFTTLSTTWLWTKVIELHIAWKRAFFAWSSLITVQLHYITQMVQTFETRQKIEICARVQFDVNNLILKYVQIVSHKSTLHG